jgi:hypothetical protein
LDVLVKICIAVAPMAAARGNAEVTPPAVEVWAPKGDGGEDTEDS